MYHYYSGKGKQARHTHYPIFSLFLLCSYIAPCQQVVNSTGSTVNDNLYSIEYSIGEIAITTLTAPSNANFTTQGLLQPSVKVINPRCEIINDTINWFPNPTQDILRIVARQDWITAYRIYAADGKLVRVAPFFNNQINMRNLPGGAYFIKLYPGCGDKLRILKVVKQ